jgi:hypothetical protein
MDAKTLSELTEKVEKVTEKNINIMVAAQRERVDKGFVMIFQDAMQDLVMEKKLTMTDIRVMLSICSIAQYGNLVSLNQNGLAEMLKMNKSMISLSIKKLIELNLLLKTKLGLFLNPSLVIKGRIDKIPAEVWDASLLQTPDAYPLKKQRGTKTAKQARAEAREVEAVDIVDEEIETGL